MSIRSRNPHRNRPWSGWLVALLFTACMTTNVHAIHVRDYGALPDDGVDHAADIQRAINAALASGDPVVEFDAGEYRVTTITGRSPFNDRAVCLQIDGTESGLTLRGAVDAQGNPATALIYDEPGPRFSVDYWMWISRSRNITIENFIIDFPGAIAAGRISRVADGKTWVELWPEVVAPRSFIQGAEYVFLFDPEDGHFLHPKITLGGGWDETRPGPPLPEVTRDTAFASMATEHQMVIDAEVGEVGMGLAYGVQWHHAPEKTLVANRVENLTFRNLTVVTALGHVLMPVGCKNITVEKLRFDPAGRGHNRGWTARRDGLTMRACRGQLRVEDSLFQCTSDDMLAFWGFQFEISQVVSPTRIVVTSRQSAGDYFLDFPIWIEEGDWIEFRRPDGHGGLPLSGVRRTIATSRFVIDRDRQMTWRRHFADTIQKEAWYVEYVLDLEEPLPDFVASTPEPRMVVLGSTLFESAVLRRVTTKNITNHPGVLIPGALDYLIEQCTFGTLVDIKANPAVRAWHGGCGIWNAVIRDNTFTSSVPVPMRKGLLAEGVDAVEPRGKILIESNTFLDSAPLQLAGSEPIIVRNNRFVTDADRPPIITRPWHKPSQIIEENNVVIAPGATLETD